MDSSEDKDSSMRAALPAALAAAVALAASACVVSQPAPPAPGVYGAPGAPGAPGAADLDAPDPAGTPADSAPAPPARSPRDAFEALARALVSADDELELTALGEGDLDGDGTLERIALLCARLGVLRDRAIYVVERGDLRWSLAFPDLDGRSRLDSLGGAGCGTSETPIVEVPWTRTRNPWIEIVQTHHGGGAWCRVALRGSRPVVIHASYVGDVREGDDTVTTDYDALHRETQAPHPELATAAAERCQMKVQVEPITPERVRALLAPR